MKSFPKISDAEWRVMNVVWTKGAATANEVVEALAAETDWNPKTVKTLLNRLKEKGALKFRKEGRAYHYYAAIDEETCRRKAGRSFLQRVYGGAFTPMLASFLEEAELTDTDIAELKQILDRKDAE